MWGIFIFAHIHSTATHNPCSHELQSTWVPLACMYLIAETERPPSIEGDYEYGSCLSMPRMVWRNPFFPGRLWQVGHRKT